MASQFQVREMEIECDRTASDPQYPSFSSNSLFAALSFDGSFMNNASTSSPSQTSFHSFPPKATKPYSARRKPSS